MGRDIVMELWINGVTTFYWAYGVLLGCYFRILEVCTTVFG